MALARRSSMGKPSRASLMAGAMTSSGVMVPYFSRAVSRPATWPGTAAFLAVAESVSGLYQPGSTATGTVSIYSRISYSWLSAR